MASGNPIPLLDFSDPNVTPEQLAQQVGHAVATVGFLHVKGAGITSEQVRGMFAISKAMFESPVEERAACPSDGKNGYIAFRANRLDEQKTEAGADYKENFTYGRFYAPDTETVQLLPPVLKKNQEELQKFHDACNVATNKLLDAFSVALNLPVNYLRDRHSQGNNGLALINYPSVKAEDAPPTDLLGVARASAHKDWGSVTLLFQEEDGTPGLEIFHEGKWWSAPIIPDTFLVNVGLALEHWTGGQFTATLHRVVTHANPDGGFKGRRSTAYFVQPNDPVVFNTINPDGSIQKVTGALTSREFFAERMRASTVAAY